MLGAMRRTTRRMRKGTLAAGLVLGPAWLALTGAAAAQESPPPTETPASAQAEEEAAAPEVPPRRRARRRARESASLELAGAKIEVAWGAAAAKGPAFEAVETLANDEVVEFPRDAALKLMTAADLLFGDLRIVEGNAAEGYPGVYSLWIERAEDGWRLVFNEKADVWGTQHDPAADVGRADLAYEQAEAETETFQVELVEEGGEDRGGRLTLSWGRHRWSAPFRIAAGESAAVESERSP